MCFEGDAENFKNLKDIETDTIKKNSSKTYKIEHNGTADYAVARILYTINNSTYSLVTYANKLSYSNNVGTCEQKKSNVFSMGVIMTNKYQKINFIIALSAIVCCLIIPIIYIAVFAQSMFAPNSYDSPLTVWEFFIAIFASMLTLLIGLTAIAVLQFKDMRSYYRANKIYLIVGTVGAIFFALVGITEACLIGALTDKWVVAALFIIFALLSVGLCLWLFVRLRLQLKSV